MVSLSKLKFWKRGNKAGGASNNNITPLPAAKPKSTQELIAYTMNEAATLTDTHETPMDKMVHFVYALIAYIGPFVVALAAGWWIGDGFAGPFAWNGDSVGVHVISIFGEIALSMLSVTLARTAKRMTNDKAIWKYLLVVSFAFLLVALASALAQWVLIVFNIGTYGLRGASPAMIIIVIGFRAFMPICIDIASLLYLAIHGYRSLKQKLAQIDERGEAFEKLHDRGLSIQAKEDKARQAREDAESDRARRKKTEDTINRVTEMQTEAAIALIEKSLSGGNVVDGTRQFRRNA
ncbi:MAG TPA: hypothetical protein VNG51_01430 [Ktedonobacteraceae bacterium]|nr:hypothetical protein [Ktedonobacteraceae bacterium]